MCTEVCGGVCETGFVGVMGLRSEVRGVRMDMLVPSARQAEKVVSLCLLKSPGGLLFHTPPAHQHFSPDSRGASWQSTELRLFSGGANLVETSRQGSAFLTNVPANVLKDKTRLSSPKRPK